MWVIAAVVFVLVMLPVIFVLLRSAAPSEREREQQDREWREAHCDRNGGGSSSPTTLERYLDRVEREQAAQGKS